jgi:hypothetical protein
MSQRDKLHSINLNVCKKLDSKVTRVIATASHVVMYSLSNGTEWVRCCLPNLGAATGQPDQPRCRI